MSENVTKGDAIVAHFHHTSRTTSEGLKQSFPSLFLEGDASIPIGWLVLSTVTCVALAQCFPDIRIQQIKTKFGTGRLNFVDDISRPEFGVVRLLVSHFENTTAAVCELCGDNGKKRIRNMWVVTCCDHCAETIGAT